MMYFLAIILPPLAILGCGKPFQAILNIPLCVLGLFPGIIHALFVVNDYNRVKVANNLIRAQNALFLRNKIQSNHSGS
jgi:uncharacterized membrane protein YqaE (UPF0057 family)